MSSVSKTGLLNLPEGPYFLGSSRTTPAVKLDFDALLIGRNAEFIVSA